MYQCAMYRTQLYVSNGHCMAQAAATMETQASYKKKDASISPALFLSMSNRCA